MGGIRWSKIIIGVWHCQVVVCEMLRFASEQFFARESGKARRDWVWEVMPSASRGFLLFWPTMEVLTYATWILPRPRRLKRSGSSWRHCSFPFEKVAMVRKRFRSLRLPSVILFRKFSFLKQKVFCIWKTESWEGELFLTSSQRESSSVPVVVIFISECFQLYGLRKRSPVENL